MAKKLMLLTVLATLSGCGCDFWSHGICVQLHEGMEDWPNIVDRIDYITETANWYCGDGEYLKGNWVMSFQYGDINCDINPFDTEDKSGCAWTQPMILGGHRIVIKLNDDNQCVESTEIIHEICHAWLDNSHSDSRYTHENICQMWQSTVMVRPECAPGPEYYCGWDCYSPIEWCTW